MLNVLTRSWARRALASSVCGVLLFCADADAQLLVPTPDHDAFYRVPGNVAGFGNGAVLGSRPITAMVGPLPLPAKAWQVKYKTLGTHGEPTSTVTTVLVPTAEWKGAGPRPLVSLQSAEDGVGARCAPSYALRAGVQAAATPSQVDLAVLVPLLLAKGWAVVVPDHEGVRHEFASARMSAHAVLDGIRAAQRFAPAAVGPAAPVAMFGYSGGGWATDLAAQLHRSYAPELRFVGIAAGGVPADIRALYRNANGSPYGVPCSCSSSASPAPTRRRAWSRS